MDLEELKSTAGRRALEYVRSGMLLGLGTGSTVAWFLEHLGEALASGRLADIAGVPTSVRTEETCRRLGIPLISLSEHPDLDLAVDGADEITPHLDLIKGLGGALLREKMVAAAAKRFLVISDHTKLVTRLGTRAPLPVEVVTFEWRSHLPFLEDLGARAVLRCGSNGSPLLTDNGNHILDCSFPSGLADSAGVQRRLEARPGVVAHGLFLGMASAALIASPAGLEVMGEAAA